MKRLFLIAGSLFLIVATIGIWGALAHVANDDLLRCDKNIATDDIEDAYACYEKAAQFEKFCFGKHKAELRNKQLFLDSVITSFGEYTIQQIECDGRSTVNVRSKASKQAKIVCHLNRGNRVRVGEITNGWAKITTFDGKEGYVYSQNLSERVYYPNSDRVRGIEFIDFLPTILLLILIVIIVYILYDRDTIRNTISILFTYLMICVILVFPIYWGIIRHSFWKGILAFIGGIVVYFVVVTIIGKGSEEKE